MSTQCSRCGKEAILDQAYSGLRLCRDHLILDLEKKVRRTVRRYHWLTHGGRIGVLLDGTPSSAALLHLLHSITEGRRDCEIIGLSLHQGDSEATRRVMDIGDSEGVEVVIHTDETAASLAVRAGCRLLACSSTLDDEATAVLIGFITGDLTSLLQDDADLTDPLPCIAPLRMIPQEEVDLYAECVYPGIIWSAREIRPVDLVSSMRGILSDYTLRHPSTLYALAHLGEEIRTAVQDTKA